MAKVTTNWRGVEEVLLSRQVASMLRYRAFNTLQAAKATAPVVTGAYRSSLHLENDQSSGGKGALRRARSRVVADVDYAFLVEADHGVLKRALDAAR